jgi:hypothetical protein
MWYAVALHPIASFSQWNSFLFWTQSGATSNYAIADGQLCFKDDRNDMESETRPIFEEMKRLWEMKSVR